MKDSTGSLVVRSVFMVMLFLAANVALFHVHVWLFQTSDPYFVFATIGAHIISLIFLPYQKLLKFNKDEK